DPGLPGITVLGLAAGLGLLSAAIPYSLDQVVLRMAGSSYFALLQAILPVVAAIVGALALGQWLTTAEIIGIVLIIIAVGLRRKYASRTYRTTDAAQASGTTSLKGRNAA